MNALITVIVPVYNVEKYLDKCIDSIVNQTYKNLEIILVDDGSPDNCPQMCDAWAEKDSRIKVIHKSNGGVSSARNAGLNIAQGEYISFVDSDDYIELNMYETLLRNAVHTFSDVVVCNIKCTDESEKPKEEKAFEDKLVTSNEEIMKQYISNTLCIPGMLGKLILKSIIDNNLRFDETKKIGEDFLFNHFVFSHSNTVMIIKEAMYYYNFVETSATNTHSKELICRWKNTKSIYHDYISKGLTDAFLIRYQSELLCCIRELFRSRNEQLIIECYDDICKEIKLYSKDFLKLNISKSNKLSIILICCNKGMFKKLYQFYKR